MFRAGVVNGGHIFAYIVYTEQPIPPDMEPHQACGNRACVSFEHLELLTHGQYIQQTHRAAMYKEKQCNQCSSRFIPVTSNQKYCHNNCRQSAWQAAHKERA